MNRLALGLLSVVSCFALPAYADIEFWHSNTLWANQGSCAAIFSFDSAVEEVTSLQVSLSAIDKTGKKVVSELLEVESFGASVAERYGSAIWEHEAMCNDSLTIVVNKANGVLNGKRVDFLKAKAFSARVFKPFKMRIGK